MNIPAVYRKLGTTSALCAALVIGGPVYLNGAITPAFSAPENSIIAAPDSVQVKAGTQQPLPLSVSSGSDVPKNAMLLISGLPPTSSLSAGRLFASGTWALRIADLNGLKIETKSTATGQMQLTLSVVSLDGKAIAERTVKLAIVTPGGGSAARPTPDPSAVTPTAALPGPTAAEQKPEVRALMSQGDNNLASGKVQVARLFYRRAAEQGYAQGALAMAHSYDPGELARLQVVGGVQPDVALAKQWYEKALALGSAEAEGGLRRLSQR
jgi:hypothetical protein